MPQTQIVPFAPEGVETSTVEFGGYLYIIEFSTGLLKVGKTRNPAKRLDQHRHHAEAFGLSITRYWVSEAHDNYGENELRLISDMHEIGGVSNLVEYFSGVTLEEAVSTTASYQFDPIDVDARSAEVKASTEELKQTFLGPDIDGRLNARRVHDEQIALDQYFAIDALFGRLPGASDNAHRSPIIVTGAAVPLSLMRDLARLKQITLSEMASYSLIDMLEDTISTRVKLAGKNLRRWAVANDRADLLSPVIIEVSA